MMLFEGKFDDMSRAEKIELINKANEITNIEAEIDKQHKRYRDLHIKRLHEGTCNAYAGAIFLDLLSNLERIGDHSTNIAEIVVENNA